MIRTKQSHGLLVFAIAEVSDKDFSELMPTGSTLSRSRLPFLAAWLKTWQSEWQAMGSFSWHVQVDSSPQFGADWCLVVVTYIRASDLNAAP